MIRLTLDGAGVARCLPIRPAINPQRANDPPAAHASPGDEHVRVYASRKHMPQALRSLLDFLALRFPPEPQWDAGL